MADRLNARRAGGFTLIELLVAVIIIAIIASFALPNYTESVRRGKRSTAKATMSAVAGRLQQYYGEQTSASYTTDLSKLSYPSGALLTEGGGHTITVEAGTAADGIVSSYLIKAVPVSSDPACPALTLDHLGAFGPAGC